jgi:hypothetical protein
MLTIDSRRDGSPFMNLCMTAPLCDSKGTVRYHIGAQVDVSGLVKDGTGLDSLLRLDELAADALESNPDADDDQIGIEIEKKLQLDTEGNEKEEFQELTEMLNMDELDTVRKWGGRMHRDDAGEDQYSVSGWTKPRLVLNETTPDVTKRFQMNGSANGRLAGVYTHVRSMFPFIHDSLFYHVLDHFNENTKTS